MVIVDWLTIFQTRVCSPGQQRAVTHPGYHAIGLRTALPAKSADVVIVTSRLSGLWPRFGNQILREAGRVGQRGVVTTRT